MGWGEKKSGGDVRLVKYVLPLSMEGRGHMLFAKH